MFSEYYYSTHINSANVLLESKHYETALVWFVIALKILQKLFGKDHEKCATLHNKISGCLFSLHRYDDARSHIDEAIRIKERVYGIGHVEGAQSLCLLGNICRHQSQFDE